MTDDWRLTTNTNQKQPTTNNYKRQMTDNQRTTTDLPRSDLPRSDPWLTTDDHGRETTDDRTQTTNNHRPKIVDRRSMTNRSKNEATMTDDRHTNIEHKQPTTNARWPSMTPPPGPRSTTNNTSFFQNANLSWENLRIIILISKWKWIDERNLLSWEKRSPLWGESPSWRWDCLRV